MRKEMTMSVIGVLQALAALATAATGLLALVRPASVQEFTGLSIAGPRGISEVRAVFGGLFIALGLAPFLLKVPAAYRMLGIGYLAIALVRLPSIVLDRSSVSSNWISLAIEVVLGVILVL
jgi:hypothetical protein